jgi:16S rRNA (cytidine1402-2'-O)-methyltransferase
MSPRAVETLKNVGLIAAEDTRVTMKLTAHYDIHTPLTSCHEHNEENKSRKIIEKMLVRISTRRLQPMPERQPYPTPAILW